ncbi:MAG: hypothetical protein SCH66_00150 [Methanolobus sp.]|nr:hypothetical protein [Methanolobus sp.]
MPYEEQIMGTITIDYDQTRYVFERTDEETNKLLMWLSGAKIIELKDQTRVLKEEKCFNGESSVKSDSVSITDAPKESVWYNPRSKEIFEYVKSQPNYRHTTKSVLVHFNPSQDITLSRREDDENRNIWYSVLQRLRRVRNNIMSEERGKWVEERVGQEKEYRFEKY